MIYRALYSDLIQHVDSLSICALCSSIRTMNMASSMNVWSPLVDSRVNHKARCIHRLIRAIHLVPFLIDPNHVGDFKQGKAYSVRVDPEGIWFDGICESSITRTKLRSRSYHQYLAS